ncbi:hypothetical protein BOTBODRAFT_185981 [Botryobasidium botryosum FD-172 SS1]|uniref:Uncharacterized protein n=1 Tax=Botryobasidium botryosum (strain FD-172 SS1) TaxID=930990 RepID=A0A067MNE3_BOTB1|nr:hypothetical protein BOTBODRAFT_185981 [Botryobasidium botryosum FD-172 SS1]
MKVQIPRSLVIHTGQSNPPSRPLTPAPTDNGTSQSTRIHTSDRPDWAVAPPAPKLQISGPSVPKRRRRTTRRSTSASNNQKSTGSAGTRATTPNRAIQKPVQSSAPAGERSIPDVAVDWETPVVSGWDNVPTSQRPKDATKIAPLAVVMKPAPTAKESATSATARLTTTTTPAPSKRHSSRSGGRRARRKKASSLSKQSKTIVTAPAPSASLTYNHGNSRRNRGGRAPAPVDTVVPEVFVFNWEAPVESNWNVAPETQQKGSHVRSAPVINPPKLESIEEGIASTSSTPSATRRVGADKAYTDCQGIAVGSGSRSELKVPTTGVSCSTDDAAHVDEDDRSVLLTIPRAHSTPAIPTASQQPSLLRDLKARVVSLPERPEFASEPEDVADEDVTDSPPAPPDSELVDVYQQDDDLLAAIIDSCAHLKLAAPAPSNGLDSVTRTNERASLGMELRGLTNAGVREGVSAPLPTWRQRCEAQGQAEQGGDPKWLLERRNLLSKSQTKVQEELQTASSTSKTPTVVVQSDQDQSPARDGSGSGSKPGWKGRTLQELLDESNPKSEKGAFPWQRPRWQETKQERDRDRAHEEEREASATNASATPTRDIPTVPVAHTRAPTPIPIASPKLTPSPSPSPAPAVHANAASPQNAQNQLQQVPRPSEPDWEQSQPRYRETTASPFGGPPHTSAYEQMAEPEQLGGSMNMNGMHYRSASPGVGMHDIPQQQQRQRTPVDPMGGMDHSGAPSYSLFEQFRFQQLQLQQMQLQQLQYQQQLQRQRHYNPFATPQNEPQYQNSLAPGAGGVQRHHDLAIQIPPNNINMAFATPETGGMGASDRLYTPAGYTPTPRSGSNSSPGDSPYPLTPASAARSLDIPNSGGVWSMDETPTRGHRSAATTPGVHVYDSQVPWEAEVSPQLSRQRYEARNQDPIYQAKPDQNQAYYGNVGQKGAVGSRETPHFGVPPDSGVMWPVESQQPVRNLYQPSAGLGPRSTSMPVPERQEWNLSKQRQQAYGQELVESPVDYPNEYSFVGGQQTPIFQGIHSVNSRGTPSGWPPS